MRHALTNVVGTRPRTDVHLFETELNAGDSILMTTDGVHEAVDDGRLERLIVRINGQRRLRTRS